MTLTALHHPPKHLGPLTATNAYNATHTTCNVALPKTCHCGKIIEKPYDSARFGKIATLRPNSDGQAFPRYRCGEYTDNAS